MHDRRVDGEALTFGNQGALYMNAMTWWDHETDSVWSQPWGTALIGLLEGTALTLIPASIVPWSTWLDQHPDTTVVIDGLGNPGFAIEGGFDDFVIGVALEGSASAYPYADAAERSVTNDRIGEHPVGVFVDADSRDIKVYLRRVAIETPGKEGPSELSFEIGDGGRIVDRETGSVWDSARGVAIEGPLKGTALQQLPFVPAYDWA